jgi:hypothetical protein
VLLLLVLLFLALLLLCCCCWCCCSRRCCCCAAVAGAPVPGAAVPGAAVAVLLVLLLLVLLLLLVQRPFFMSTVGASDNWSIPKRNRRKRTDAERRAVPPVYIVSVNARFHFEAVAAATATTTAATAATGGTAATGAELVSRGMSRVTTLSTPELEEYNTQLREMYGAQVPAVIRDSIPPQQLVFRLGGVIRPN